MQLHQEFANKGLEVLTVNVDGTESTDEVQEVLTKLGIGLTNLLINEGSSKEALAAIQCDGGVPALNIYDRSGELRHSLVGMDAIDHDAVHAHVKALMTE